MLLCIAGVDGSGKTTLVQKLFRTLSKEHKCASLRLYDLVIRPDLQKKSALYLRHNNIEINHHNLMICYLMNELKESTYPKLKQELKSNEIVILDRYLETIDFIADNYHVNNSILDNVIKDMPVPDLYIYLKVNPDTAYSGIIHSRIIPHEGEQLHEIIEAVNYYNSHAGQLGMRTVDGEKSQEEIEEICLTMINEVLAVKNSRKEIGGK